MSRPFDHSRLRVYPLAERRSLTRVEEILVDPDSPPPRVSDEAVEGIRHAAQRIASARRRGAAVVLIYGAHLLRNGAARIVGRLMRDGWLTLLATNGAGSIHDWEYAWCGQSTENVADGVLHGRFGTWDETGRAIHLALLAGGLVGEGYGRALGRFVAEDGATLPSRDELRLALRDRPDDPHAPARADLLRAMLAHDLPEGRIEFLHRHRHASIVGQAFAQGVPLTVHPGIGYDIVANHPMFNGAVLGRAAEWDFETFAGELDRLDGGVVLNVGSAIMGPQVFEKSLSCVNNLRLQDGRPVVTDHAIVVVDLQDGGRWDWTRGEPPKTHPAYYLRFCKSFSRTGGSLHYLQCDNLAFVHRLYHELNRC